MHGRASCCDGGWEAIVSGGNGGWNVVVLQSDGECGHGHMVELGLPIDLRDKTSRLRSMKEKWPYTNGLGIFVSRLPKGFLKHRTHGCLVTKSVNFENFCPRCRSLKCD